MYTVKDVYKHAGEASGRSGRQEQRAMVEALANDPELLEMMVNMIEKVKIR